MRCIPLCCEVERCLRTARTQGLQQRGRHWKLMWYCCIWWILVFCKCRLLKDYFLNLHGMVFKVSQGGSAEGWRGVGGQEKEPAFPGKCQMYFDHILGPLGMVLERDDSTRPITGSGPWERPRNGGKIEVRSPPVTQRYHGNRSMLQSSFEFKNKD